MYAELDPRRDLQPHLPRILNRDVYYAGQTIISQGAPGHRAFYIEKGRVEVIVREGDYSVRVAELGAGEIFGEMALIEHGERSAAVRAIEDTTVTVIGEADMERKIKAIDDQAINALMQVFLKRLRRSNEGLVAHYRHLAEFQDRVAGLVEKAHRGISEDKRREFRDEAEPLLEQLESLLDKYRDG